MEWCHCLLRLTLTDLDCDHNLLAFNYRRPALDDYAQRFVRQLPDLGAEAMFSARPLVSRAGPDYTQRPIPDQQVPNVELREYVHRGTPRPTATLASWHPSVPATSKTGLAPPMSRAFWP